MKNQPPQESHPSYGTVKLSRININGATPLFGSHLGYHTSVLQLEIHGAVVESRDGQESYYDRDLKIQVEMSQAQFASFLTNMNSTGTPCTIRRFNGESIAKPPFRETEHIKVRQNFEKRVSGMGTMLDEALNTTKAKLEQPRITKGDLQEIQRLLEATKLEYKSNLPFMMTLFQESAEKVVSEAKAEIDAFLLNVMNSTGLQAIKEKVSQKIFPVSVDEE